MTNGTCSSAPEAAFASELQQLAQAPADQVRRAAAEAVQQAAGDQPREVQVALTAYLTQVPAMVRRVSRRPSDPTGKTVPPSLVPRRPEDLLGHDCLVFGTSERATWELTHGRIKKQVQVHGRVAMNSQPALRDLAIAGMGIARLPEAVCREALARRQLEVVLPRFSTSPGGIFILYPGGRYVSPKVRAFVEFVSAQLTVVRSRRAQPA